MKEMIDKIRTGLDLTGELVELILNGLSLFFIMMGLIMALVASVGLGDRLRKIYPLHLYFRMKFGGWLVVALEFQLAADIVATIISPDTGHLIELGAIAVIRTFLNYFLSRELKEELELFRRADAREQEKEHINQK
jgi:uncharacterized membrane protein